jgi:hypothetical protein
MSDLPPNTKLVQVITAGATWDELRPATPGTEPSTATPATSTPASSLPSGLLTTEASTKSLDLDRVTEDASTEDYEEDIVTETEEEEDPRIWTRSVRRIIGARCIQDTWEVLCLFENDPMAHWVPLELPELRDKFMEFVMDAHALL